MRASAHLSVARTETPGYARTRIERLCSDPPLVLRPVKPGGSGPLRRWDLDSLGATRVCIAAGAAGPVGGDELRLSVEVGPGAVLNLRTVAATLLLPGPHGQVSRSEFTAHVGQDATLVWLPDPVIAAHGCNHQSLTRVTLERGARLVVSEQLLLGRHGERPGSVRQRLRVCQDGRPLYDQELAVGPEVAGWDGPAVLGGRRAIGSILVVDPQWGDGRQPVPVSLADEDVATMPLGGSAVLIVALAADGLALRARLASALATIESSAPAARPSEPPRSRVAAG